MKIAILAIFALIAIQVGCSVPISMLYFKESPRAPVKDDAEAKMFIADTKKGTIYIFRDRLIGNDDAFQVLIDDKIIGNLGVYTYFSFKVPPGKYVMSIGSEIESVNISIRRGKIIFLLAEFGTLEGIHAEESTIILTKVSEERGRLGVMHSDRLRHQYHIIPLLNQKPVR